MKKSLIYTLAIGILAVTACKKLPEGNLSDIVRYEVLPMEIKRGRAEVSTAINPAGSSKPTEYKLLNIYEKESGKDVTSVFEKTYPLKIWKALHDPKVDKSFELIYAKMKDTLVAPLSINKFSGAIETNKHTINLPKGNYVFDLEIKNSNGTRIYPKIGEFKVIDAPFFEIPAVRSTTAMKVGAETTTKSIPSNADHIKVTALDTIGNKITVRFLDKNGVPFNPKAGEIERRPNSGTAGGFLQTMQDYAMTTALFDDRIEFTYGVMPFPLYSLGNGFNYYYRIPAKYVKYDDSLGLPYNTYSCNPRFSFRTYYKGNYTIDVIVPQVIRVTP